MGVEMIFRIWLICPPIMICSHMPFFALQLRRGGGGEEGEVNEGRGGEGGEAVNEGRGGEGGWAVNEGGGEEGGIEERLGSRQPQNLLLRHSDTGETIHLI